MILGSVGAVLGFLLLVIPGYVWEKLAPVDEPGVKVSTWREVVQVMFASVVPSGLSAIIFYRVWLAAFDTDANPLAPIAAGLMTSAVACIFVVIFFFLRSLTRRSPTRENSRRRIDHLPVMYHALVKLPEKSKVSAIVATIRLLDGTMWQGTHAAHDIDPEVPLRTLLLKPPLYRRDADSTEIVPYGKADYVVLPLDQVSSLQLKYLSGKPNAAGSAETPEQQVPSPRLPPAEDCSDVTR